MADALLQLDRVSIAFGGLRAVQDVSLEVAPNTLTALIGPNGAGKTTLFALMSGFLKPDSGTINFDGRDITGAAPHDNARAGMTRTFQVVQPFAAQTVRENIAAGAHLHEARRAAALAMAEEVARRVGYDDPSHFSRDYRRQFGEPPLRDVQRLRESAAAAP